MRQIVVGRNEGYGHEFILSGDVDCEGAPGRYTWEIIDNTLEIDVMEDDCMEQSLMDTIGFSTSNNEDVAALVQCDNVDVDDEENVERKE